MPVTLIFAKLLLLASLLTTSGCTSVQGLSHAISDRSVEPKMIEYQDRGNALYYEFLTDPDTTRPDTYVFVFGGSRCTSWRLTMPNYTDGLDTPARVFALNKRFVSDHSTGLIRCSEPFHQFNHPKQWRDDLTAFIQHQLRSSEHTPKNIVLVGVSEGANTVLDVAHSLPQVSHVAIIGSGGFSVRESLKTLREKNYITLDVQEGLQQVAESPHSLSQTWYGHPHRWWTDVLDIDPMPSYLRLDIPILVGIGERDQRVPVESVYYLQNQFEQRGKTNLITKVYPNADHQLNARQQNYLYSFFSSLSDMIDMR